MRMYGHGYLNYLCHSEHAHNIVDKQNGVIMQ